MVSASARFAKPVQLISRLFSLRRFTNPASVKLSALFSVFFAYGVTVVVAFIAITAASDCHTSHLLSDARFAIVFFWK